MVIVNIYKLLTDGFGKLCNSKPVPIIPIPSIVAVFPASGTPLLNEQKTLRPLAYTFALLCVKKYIFSLNLIRERE
ncbi:MAG: hypothetical protein HC836_06695 [Richelia sp. RM2_1_2]|nr:hypothetical protein [Richelia sp. SM2_1_7]NJM18047.1 hypothetical protein [Richelia sp. SM1_7_0]NJN07997.1 hypothetical protein [Richelia sp. RM1_1_1]NJO28453.1 hypothetical protein [Richelia sp. SL_2_1]NJO58048.1 hypothetical protein [Richelia sp. RM2_1_2]